MAVKQELRTDAVVTDQVRLVTSLRNPTLYGSDVDQVTVVETHISYVLLAGRYAYKIKKAVDLAFLNFATLAARRFYCEEELRLNRRLAPATYLEVVAITGSVQAPAIGGSGPVIEYAVKMRQFDQDNLLSRLLTRDALTRDHIDALAQAVASFHAHTDRALTTAAFGTPKAILEPALQNFSQMSALVTDPRDRGDLSALRDWTAREHARCTPLFEKRRDGFIRECHGDLHLNNIALIDGKVTLFDCIEFNESMRWIDVMSDVAFLVMDLHERGRPNLAARFLNGYLEIAGDYEGLGLLSFYVAYRAMVRAKIASLRASQVASAQDGAALQRECRQYIQLATLHGQGRPAIVVTHGLAGSGKTTVSEELLEFTGAIRVRTDVERKRLHGLSADAHTDSPVAEGIYTENETQRVYRHVCSLVRGIVTAGYVAIADGTFLKRWQRDQFRDAATALGVPFMIVSCSAPLPTLRRRVERRLASANNASEATAAVLEEQMRMEDTVAPEEASYTVTFDSDTPIDRARLVALCRTHLPWFVLSP